MDSYATGAVSAVAVSGGNSYAGGIVGNHDDLGEGSRRIERCYATGAISASGSPQAGGITGGNSSNASAVIAGCAALSPSVSGVAGSVYRISSSANTTFNNNIAYDSMTLTGSPAITSDSNGVHGGSKDSAAIKDKATYAALGWDFANTWEMGSDGYPVLQWQQ
jgi:hypothetical protein